jgi:AraC family transcriptional regulator, arabinose operon regulatory protein
MTVHIGYCGYSYYTKQFFSQKNFKLQDYIFRLQTEGFCEVLVNGKRRTVQKGDLLMLKPGDQYELMIEDGQNSGDYYLFCNGTWLDHWWNQSPKPSFAQIELDEKLLSLWDQIIIEERRPLSYKNKDLLGYLLKALCLSLERIVNETSSLLSRPYSVTKMMRYIEEHATVIFKIEEVALHAGLSVSRAGHLFKNHVGKTMIEYALEIRLSSAINQMKYTSLNLEQIAENCGFGTYPYFHRVFKNKYGTAPGIYRKLNLYG